MHSNLYTPICRVSDHQPSALVPRSSFGRPTARHAGTHRTGPSWSSFSTRNLVCEWPSWLPTERTGDARLPPKPWLMPGSTGTGVRLLEKPIGYLYRVGQSRTRRWWSKPPPARPPDSGHDPPWGSNLRFPERWQIFDASALRWSCLWVRMDPRGSCRIDRRQCPYRKDACTAWSGQVARCSGGQR